MLQAMWSVSRCVRFFSSEQVQAMVCRDSSVEDRSAPLLRRDFPLYVGLANAALRTFAWLF